MHIPDELLGDDAYDGALLLRRECVDAGAPRGNGEKTRRIRLVSAY
jgi:hypothetical protein